MLPRVLCEIRDRVQVSTERASRLSADGFQCLSYAMPSAFEKYV